MALISYANNEQIHKIYDIISNNKSSCRLIANYKSIVCFISTVLLSTDFDVSNYFKAHLILFDASYSIKILTFEHFPKKCKCLSISLYNI